MTRRSRTGRSTCSPPANAARGDHQHRRGRHLQLHDRLPGTYRVCEGTGPAGFVQTYPNAGTPLPAGETIINTCPAPNIWGYEFTVAGGDALTGDDFGNFQSATKSGMKFNDVNGNGVKDGRRRRHRELADQPAHHRQRRPGVHAHRPARHLQLHEPGARHLPGLRGHRPGRLRPDLSPTRSHPHPPVRPSSTPVPYPTSGATSSPSPAAPSSQATTSETS